MAKQSINVGTAANDKKGDSLRAAFQKVNANFTELYEAVGLATTGQDTALTFLGSTLSTDDSSSIVIDRATTVTSNLSVGGDIVPQTANGGDLGSSTLPWRSLYVSNNTIYIGGTAVGIDANGNLTTNGTTVGGGGANLGNISNGTGPTTDPNSLVSSASAAFINFASDLDGAFGLGTNDGSLVKITTDGGASAFEFTADNGAGSIKFPDLSTQTTAYNPNSIRSEGDINIEINLSDSTLRRWSFGEDGSLTLPNGSTIGDGDAVSGVPITTTRGSILIGNQAECLGGENHFHIMKAGQQDIDLFLGDDNNYVKLPSTGGVEISSSEIGAQHYWTFGTDGSLTLPGDIKSNGNINIDINLSDSTLRRWQFGEDGDTVFPNNVSINYSGNNVQFPRIIADSGKAFSVQGQGSTGSAALSWTVDPNAAGQYAAVSVSRAGGDNLAKVVLQAQSDSGDAGTAKTWKFNETGTLTLPNGSVIKDTDGYAVAIGVAAGSSNQGSLAVAVGAGAGYTGQGTSAVAIGRDAGGTAQGINAVAIGDAAGETAQGINAVAIGIQAGYANQAANSIIINATGTTLNQTVANTFTVKPVRQGETADAMYYNSSTGEITYAGAFSFSVAADDSTQRSISSGELVKFIGAGGITTSSDAEGYITITGSGGSVSSLVNGAYTVSLGSTGTLTVPANGIITAPINQEFQLQAKAADSVLRNEINLDPNNGTYMSVWSDELNTSFSTGAGSWVTASWNNEDGFGAARFTGAEDLQNFWTTGPGSIVESVEVSINGGARGRAGYEGNNGGGYGVYLSVDQVPPGGQGTTVPITSLVFYFRTKNRIDIDYLNGQLLLATQYMTINLETNSYINLKSTRANPVRIITNNNTHMWEFDSTGSLTLPREGKIYGIGQGAASDRYGYISWDGNSSGDGSGYNTMRLVPDLQGLEAADQYIILDPTGGAPGHIHIRAGGTQDNSGAHLYLGGEHSHVKISAGLNPPVTIMANDNSWTFGTDGAITTTDPLIINVPNGVPSSVSNWVGDGGWNAPPYTNLATTGGTGTGLTVNVSTAAGGYIDINAITINTAGTGYTNGDVITINNENNIPGTFTIGVAGTNSWAFGTSGDLTIPGDIKGTANTSIIIDGGVLLANVTVDSVDGGGGVWRMFITSSAYPTLGTIVQVGDTATTAWGTPVTVTITSIVQDVGAGTWALHTNQNITTGFGGTRRITINSTRVKTWTFNTDKSLTFPDATVQTTAWTGAPATLNVTGAATAERFNTDQITVVGNRISTTVTNANLELECNGSGGVVINAIADATTASTVKSVGYLGLPQSATATDGTLAMSDAGKHIYVTTAGQTISIPDNSSVAYPIGTTLTFIAGPSATTMLIVINQDTLRLAGSTSTGTRTLAANGMATAVKVASTLWYINGIGLT